MVFGIQVAILVLGLPGLIYAFLFERVRMNILESLPTPFNNRRVVFALGLVVVLVSYGLAFLIGVFHGFIALLGGWIMLLSSAPWFTLRIERKLFASVEMKVIRQTMIIGILIILAGFLLIPLRGEFSPGGLMAGLAIALLAGRLWWREDLTYETMTMSHSKRDYS